MTATYKEALLQRSFSENSSLILKDSEFLGKEIALLPAYHLLFRDTYEDIIFGENKFLKKSHIGRIDLKFKYKSTVFLAEIKYEKLKNSDFWDALKIIGYTAYYKWQFNDSHVKPAIIMPAKKIKLEHQVVASRLGLSIFGVKENKGFFHMFKLSDEPYWKQKQFRD